MGLNLPIKKSVQMKMKNPASKKNKALLGQVDYVESIRKNRIDQQKNDMLVMIEQLKAEKIVVSQKFTALQKHVEQLLKDKTDAEVTCNDSVYQKKVIENSFQSVEHQVIALN